ncbi:peroxidase P7-like [Rhodamnia argentea]|uniref:Peroxidase n=1 Tax=Rhodamnia argentea TaxID=178133 RepID=A0A8B8PIC2_9MYRT|nr:peroxidase P7-like [Rhodamnia argentea]
MASSAASSSFPMAVLSSACVLVLVGATSSSQLSSDYYDKSCPALFPTVRLVVGAAIAREARMGASLLRLFFHDCFVNGCDGSLLLDDMPTFIGEKNATPNINSVRGFEVVDQVKSAVEGVCPGTVSCADLLAIIARDSVLTLGGPWWPVKLGRRDARSASQSAANAGIPPPTSNLAQIIISSACAGLSASDIVTLAGAHTIGLSRCTNFRDRVYNDTNIDILLAQTRKLSCPGIGGVGDDNLAPLDFRSPVTFDNSYYLNLVHGRGLLHSDQQLFSGGPTDALVELYSRSPLAFYEAFVVSITRMGDIKPLTGSNGEIRRNCRRVN